MHFNRLECNAQSQMLYIYNIYNDYTNNNFFNRRLIIEATQGHLSALPKKQ